MPDQGTRSTDSILVPLSILLVSRIGLFVLAYLGLALLPTARNTFFAEPGNFFLDGWLKWDGQWEAHLVRDGYTDRAADESGQRDVVNFPLYPLLVRGVSKIIPDVFVAGLLVSNLSFIVAGILLFRLAESKFDSEVAHRVIVLLCVYPFSYTFSAMYTESTFILCAIAAFILGEKQQWLLAALFAAAAGATRVVGVATTFALAIMYLQSTGWKLRRNMAWLATGLLGPIAYVIFLWWRFRDPFGFATAQQAKGWGDFNSWQSVIETWHSWRTASFGNVASGNVPLLLTLHVVMIVIALPLVILAFKKLSLAYAGWAAMVMVASLFRWGCFGRHFSTMFPCFIVAALLLHDRRSYHALVYISTLLLALLTLMFTHSLWVA